MSLSTPPHRTLTNPIFLQRIFFFATKEPLSPVVFNSVHPSWSETVIEYKAGEFGWRNLLETPPTRKNEDKIKNFLTRTCRTCKHEWVFDALLATGIDLSKNYTGLILLDTILNQALNEVNVRAKIGVEEEDVEQKEKETNEQEQAPKSIEHFIHFAKKLLLSKSQQEKQKDSTTSKKIIKGSLFTLPTALKLKDKCPFDLIKLIVEESGVPCLEKSGNNCPLQILLNEKPQPRLDVFEFLLQLGANPFRSSGVFQSFTPIKHIIEKEDMDFLKAVFTHTKKEFWANANSTGSGASEIMTGIFGSGLPGTRQLSQHRPTPAPNVALKMAQDVPKPNMKIIMYLQKVKKQYDEEISKAATENKNNNAATA